MLIVSAILLVAIALFAVAYPVILRPRSAQPAAASAQEALDELLAQRDAAFQALRELNFDHRVGKITEEDFVAFEAHLKQVAADALRALDAWEAEADGELGRTLEAVRQRRTERSADGRACPACGRPVLAEDKFCAGCGAALPVESAPAEDATLAHTCPVCGRVFQPGERFCGGCGQALQSGGGYGQRQEPPNPGPPELR